MHSGVSKTYSALFADPLACQKLKLRRRQEETRMKSRMLNDNLITKKRCIICNWIAEKTMNDWRVPIFTRNIVVSSSNAV